jgi:hypothetical protein
MGNGKKEVLGYILGFFQIIYGLFWILGILFLLVGIVIPFSGDVKDDFCGVWINFRLEDSESAVLVNGIEHATTLSRTTGWLLIENGPIYLSYMNLGFFLILIGAGLYSLNKTIKIVQRVRDGNVFLIENMVNLRKIALVSLFSVLFLITIRLVAELLISKHLVSDIMVNTGLIGSSFNLNFESFVFPLFLLVLSEVFRKGIELKDEQDLTI